MNNFTSYKWGAQFYDRIWGNFTYKTLAKITQTLNLESLADPGKQENQIRLLDLACGTGALEIRLVRVLPNIQIFALDNSPEMLSQARAKLKGNPQVGFLQSDVTLNLPFAPATFDYVVFANALHYVAQPSQLLQEIRRVIKPAGQLIIEDYTVHGPLFWLYFEKLIRLLDSQHYRTYNLSEMLKLVSDAGFIIESEGNFKIDLLWQGMYLKGVLPLGEIKVNNH